MHDLDADRGERAREYAALVSTVKPEQQLVTNGDQFDVHAIGRGGRGPSLPSQIQQLRVQCERDGHDHRDYVHERR